MGGIEPIPESLRPRVLGSGAGAAGLGRPVAAVGIDVERPGGSLDDLLGDHDLLDPFQARQIEHGVEQDAFHDRAQAARAGLAVDRLAGDGAQRFLGKRQIDRFHLEQPLVLLDQRVLRLDQDFLQRRLVEILKRRDDRQAADEFRDQAVFEQVLGLDLAEDFALLAVFRRHAPWRRSRSRWTGRARK